MTINLSAPHNYTHLSISSLISLEEFSLCYRNIDQTIQLIKNAGYGAGLAKVDITSAFKVMPIYPDFWHLLGICWKGKFYFAVALNFWLQINYAVPYLVHLLVNFVTITLSHFLPFRKFF